MSWKAKEEMGTVTGNFVCTNLEATLTPKTHYSDITLKSKLVIINLCSLTKTMAMLLQHYLHATSSEQPNLF